MKHEIDVDEANLRTIRSARRGSSLRHLTEQRVLLPAADADTVARILMANPDVALDTHSRLELGAGDRHRWFRSRHASSLSAKTWQRSFDFHFLRSQTTSFLRLSFSFSRLAALFA